LPQDWWTVFRDPELDRLVILALAENRDLQNAAARLEAAQARARLAGADAALQLSGQAGAGRSRSSESTGIPFAPHYQTRLNMGLQFAYEVDLWGRLRATREAAAKTVELTDNELAAAEITLAAEVARDHLTRLALQREAAVLARQINTYSETERLLAIRVDAGFTSELDLQRLRVEKASREGEQTAFVERDQALANALSLLCGQAAANTATNPVAPGEAVVPILPETLSLALLERRPDVAARRAKWEAAFQRVQAARAAFYPSLRLTGTLGAESERLEDLLDWQSRLWSLVGGLTAPLLDGGRLKASLQIENAALKEAAADYESAVLTAYREVADALNTLHAQAGRQRTALRAQEAAQRAVSISQERYIKGFVAYLEVVESERSLLSAERTLIQVQLSRQVATVDLVRALGIP
jgi:NodT family efflux transporter outer membrane factor (OMF) lipoprotein